MINNEQSELKKQLQEVQMFYRHTMKKRDEAQSKLDKCQRENQKYSEILCNKQKYGKMLRKTIIDRNKQIIDMRADIFELKMKYTDLFREHEDLKKKNQQLQTQVSALFNASLETTSTNPIVSNGDAQSSLSSEENPAPSSPRTPPRTNSQKTSGLQSKETPMRKTRKKTRQSATGSATGTGLVLSYTPGCITSYGQIERIVFCHLVSYTKHDIQYCWINQTHLCVNIYIYQK